MHPEVAEPLKYKINELITLWVGPTTMQVLHIIKTYAFHGCAAFVYISLSLVAMYFPFSYLEFLSGKNIITTYPYEDSDFFFNYVVKPKDQSTEDYD